MSPISNHPSTLWLVKENNQKVIKYWSCTLWFQSRITESRDYKIPNRWMLSTFRMPWTNVSKFYLSGLKKILLESDHKVLSPEQSEHFLKETKIYRAILNVLWGHSKWLSIFWFLSESVQIVPDSVLCDHFLGIFSLSHSGKIEIHGFRTF